ncbi:winged helix-turn-helix transcriptional regulator [Streptomyces albospinus]|uniref:winged helix-turn-helix transcriptional regulator n=1 Tax=Streptomyces albospinus TaxID=285515 RepID=UPI00166F7C70|nr:helix-turn-helix transcriptional regulator [Streptomyces albospinus]
MLTFGPWLPESTSTPAQLHIDTRGGSAESVRSAHIQLGDPVGGDDRRTVRGRRGVHKLVDTGLLTRERYAGGPIRNDHEYRLTQACLDLFPAMMILMQWGAIHLTDDMADAEHKPLNWTHEVCGSRPHTTLTCGRCGDPVTV